MPKFCVLIIDDDLGLLEILKRDLEPLGHSLVTASTTQQANALIISHLSSLVLIICDHLPEMDALEFRRSVFEKTHSIPFIVLSEQISKEAALTGVDLKIAAFIEKPYQSEHLRSLVAKESQYRAEQLKEESEILEAFTRDAELLIEEAEPLILGLESNPSDLESIDRLCAIVHTVKGSSGFFHPPTINKFAHRYEDFIIPYKKREATLDATSISILLKGLDVLKTLIQALKEGRLADYNLQDLLAILEQAHSPKTQTHSPPSTDAPANKGDNAPKAPAAQGREDIRVSIKVLDEFMELSGELTVIRNMLYKVVQTVERELPGNKNIGQLSELFGELHHINSQMQDKILDLRKVPLQNILRPLQRTIRDLSQSLKKPLSLDVEGGELRVDTALAEVLSNSMIHMIRNSADHGIESPEIRKERKKAEQGKLKFIAIEEMNEIVVKLCDDGNGIDPEMIRKKIVEKGLRTFEQAQKMNTSELQNMIFEPGFSTAKQVTDVSGRGVGMDMVKKSISKIGGTVEISSTPTIGSTIVLHLPIPKTVLIIASLLVRAGKQLFAIPQEKISRLITVPAASRSEFLRPIEGGTCLVLDGEIKPLISLENFLNGEIKGSAFVILTDVSQDVTIIMVEGKHSEFGVVVDEIFDLEDTVVKKLGSHLRSLEIYLGATYLADGAIGLVLNVEGIEASMQLKQSESLRSRRTLDLDSAQKCQLRDILLFELENTGLYGVYLSEIFRIEEFSSEEIQSENRLPVTIYHNRAMPLFCLSSLLEYRTNPILLESRSSFSTLVIKHNDHFIGLCVEAVTDLIPTSAETDTELADAKGILGSSIVNDKTITLLDLKKILNRISQIQVLAA